MANHASTMDADRSATGISGCSTVEGLPVYRHAVHQEFSFPSQCYLRFAGHWKSMTTIKPIATDIDQLEHRITRHPQREDRAIEAVMGVLAYCKKLEDQGVQRLVTGDLRQIINDVFCGTETANHAQG